MSDLVEMSDDRCRMTDVGSPHTSRSGVDRGRVEKVERFVDALEKRFGLPQWEGRRDPLDSLIGTILSQNTNDTNRDRAYRSLRERFPTWESVLGADPKDIADTIRVGGLANQKSVRIRDILAWIKKTYGRLNLDFICDMDTEEAVKTFCALKGVGMKTISVVLLFACGRDVFPVDTHIHRITRRLGLIPPNCSPEKAHKVMGDLVPEGKSYSFHLNLIKLGRTICHAPNPKCEECPLWDECAWRKAHFTHGNASGK